ncbi:MAG: hypothetical protein WD431_11845 [Cyclobacteriaceae bacterium]
MTNLENIFYLFECYDYDQIRERMAEARKYLENGSEEFSMNVRPLDVTESVYFLNKLNELIDGLVHKGSSRVQITSNGVSLSLAYLKENFSSESLVKLDADLKILQNNLRIILNEKNIVSYQRISDFFEQVSASFDAMK